MSRKKEEQKSPEQLKEIYEKDYVEEYAKIHSPLRLERLMNYIHINSNYAIADFACGDGMLMPLLAPRVASYLGVDFSEEFIKKAQERKRLLGIKNADFYCADINDFCDAHPESFDCAFAMDFSEHVYDDEWVKILTGIKKTLKKDGRLYVHTPNALFLTEELKTHRILMNHHPGHVAVRSPDENVRLIIKSGYTIEKLWLLPHYNFLRFIHFLSYLPLMGKYFKARVFIEASK